MKTETAEYSKREEFDIVNILIYAGLEREEYALVRSRFDERNRRMVGNFSVVAALLSVVMMTVDIVWHLNGMWWLYCAVAAASLVFFFLNRKLPAGRFTALILSYALLGLALAYGIVLTVSSGKPDQTATSIIVLLAIAPLLVTDVVWRMTVFVMIFTGAFILQDMVTKTQPVFALDLSNVLTFVPLGLIVYGIISTRSAREVYEKVHVSILQGDYRTLSEQIVEALVGIIDAKDKYTNGHSERVAEYSREIARRMGKSKEEIDRIYYAAMMHDVGKIGVPDEIINKPSSLTPEEYGIMKEHSMTGYSILSTISQMPELATAARNHHERYDGKGYPDGLTGGSIPEIARIICVADCYDAMSSNRSYRNKLPREKVREEIMKGCGTQFDPDAARIMLEMIDEDPDYLMSER